MRRIEDIEHDLLHGDFAQGRTVKSLRQERDVQNWVAERLRIRQSRSYSVEREPHVIEEKEPDVRLRAKASDASVAIEIKVIKTWTVPELEKALKDQLCGRYLRAAEGKHGILLLVHQRSKRWKQPKTGDLLSFEQVVNHLKNQAMGIASATKDSPQPEICVIDVSKC